MLKLKVEGMSCDHCVRTVTKAVEALGAAGKVTVDLAAGEVSVEGAADPSAVRRAIEAAGYEVKS